MSNEMIDQMLDPVIDHVDMTMPAAFVWDYDDRRPRLTRLYEKSKVSQWNASTDIDWTIPFDISALNHDDPRFAAMQFDKDASTDPVHAFMSASEANAREMARHDHAWLVSQFMHGEQGALVATAKICAGAESIDDKYYAAQQVADEARHVEAYQKYLDLCELDYPITTSLHALLDDVLGHRHIDMTFLGMQILVEGVALAAFSLGDALMGNPVIAQVTDLVRKDEARHVAFGVLSLQGRYHDMDPIDLAEREEFVLEACALMRDRFVPVQVWEHFGFDVDQAKAAFLDSPDMAAFRSLMFSKVVPNLRKLGLLTPKVREGFEQLGILRYERYVDSATEAGELDPDDGEADTADPLTALRLSLGTVEQIAPEPVLMVLANLAEPQRLAQIEPASIRINVTNESAPPSTEWAGDWLVNVGPGGVQYAPTKPGEPADVTLTMDVGTWTDIISGRVTAPAAVLNGQVALEGDVAKALALEAFL
ncbi:MAG: diiron oxygenase [Actinobacteria bacterium]|nr:diiron oxygenase [Actinomycetota bacterium]